MELKTDRLYLRPIHMDDMERIFEYRSDSIANKFQGWIPEKMDEVVAFINKVSSVIDIPDTWFQFVVFQKDRNRLIGDIGIHFIDHLQVEIGCTLNKRFQGEGFATEALKRVVDFLFLELKKHRIITSIDPENMNSIKLVERLGFRKEAHFVESLFINGKWTDDVVYALLQKEWS